MVRVGSAPRTGRGRRFFLQRYAALGQRVKPVSLTPSVRMNTLRTSSALFEKRMASLGVVLEKIPYTRHGYWVRKATFSLGAMAENLLGYFYMQEAAAQLPVQVLDPQQGETVLDMAAAPGGKATQIAQWMDNKGLVVALERKESRMPALKVNLERMGTENVVAYQMDSYHAKTLGMKFDKILLDAPCSGNFVADPYWFDKRTVPDIERSAKIQFGLLGAAVRALRKGGVLVYATCSLEPEENEMNIDRLLREFPQMSLEKIDVALGEPGVVAPFGNALHRSLRKCRRFWPHKTKTQGFFMAKLRKDAR